MIFKREYDNYYMRLGHKAEQNWQITCGMQKQILTTSRGAEVNYFKRTHRLRGQTAGLQYCQKCKHRWLQALEENTKGKYLFDPYYREQVEATMGHRRRGLYY